MATKTLWTEDDCTGGLSGHEGVDAAWKKLFGTNLAEQKPTADYDHGDTSETQYGRISVWNFYGAYHKIEERSE